MWESLKPIYPAGPCNRTDPIVRHDSPYNSEPVAMLYQPQYDLADSGIIGQPEDPQKLFGVFFPIIRFNNHLLGEEQVIKFCLHNDRFMPYIDLVFEDSYNTIEFADMPGLNNVVTVIMVENEVTCHKPIKMNFYTTQCEVINQTFYVQAEFKCLPLEEERLLQDTFNPWPHQGCPAKWCQLGPNFHPTTYEFLHVVASKCGLGFSATQYTKEISDDRYRILKREKYKDAVQRATACGGINGDNMFDSWIDPWGMLVLANVKWEFSETVLPDELATITSTGVETADGMTSNTKKNLGYCHRILSNSSKIAGYHNLLINDIRKHVDLGSGYYDGTLTDYHVIYPEGVKYKDGTPSRNDLSLQQIQEKENSNPGRAKADEYVFQANSFAGFDMAELTQTVEQRQRHDEYFKKMRAKIYQVTLQEPNYGLERGMLCFVHWFTQETVQKQTVLQWRENLHDDQSGAPQDLHDLGENEALDDQQALILDVSTSGLYYIDGTDWEWDPDNGKIVQHLYLIKRNALTEYFNKSNPARYKVKPES